jgi:SPP1 family predicted phage head-tail adaptor
VSRGRSTHLVTFSSPTLATDGAGQKVLTYTVQFTMRCDALILSSRKAEEYDQVQSGSDVVQFRMPYNDKIKVDWRANWNGSDWDVRTVRDLDGGRRVLEVTAERFGQ